MSIFEAGLQLEVEIWATIEPLRRFVENQNTALAKEDSGSVFDVDGSGSGSGRFNIHQQSQTSCQSI